MRHASSWVLAAVKRASMHQHLTATCTAKVYSHAAVTAHLEGHSGSIHKAITNPHAWLALQHCCCCTELCTGQVVQGHVELRYNAGQLLCQVGIRDMPVLQAQGCELAAQLGTSQGDVPSTVVSSSEQ